MKNLILVGLLSLNAGIQVADFYVTERGLMRGCREINPWGQTRGARIGLKAVGIAVPLILSCVCHWVGWHHAEPWMPVIFLVPSGIALVLNLRF